MNSDEYIKLKKKHLELENKAAIRAILTSLTMIGSVIMLITTGSYGESLICILFGCIGILLTIVGLYLMSISTDAVKELNDFRTKFNEQFGR